MLPGLIFVGSCFTQAVQNSGNNSSFRETRSSANTSKGSGSSNSLSEPFSKEKKMSEETVKQVTMRATAQNTEAALIVSYEVENLTDQELYLWDGMVGFEGTNKVVDKDSAYVFFEEPKTLRILRADLPLPKLRSVGKKQILFARLLGPKAKLTGKISLKHPVREYSPYYEPMTEEEQDNKRCSQIRLLVGWTAPKAGMRIEERTLGGDKVYDIRGAWDGPYQEILEQFIPVQVDLLTYTGVFERQMPLR